MPTNRLRRNHLLGLYYSYVSTVHSLGRCRCNFVAMACPRHRSGRRRQQRNPTTRGSGAAAVGDGGATVTPPLPPTLVARHYHLRPLGSGLAQADGSPVAPPRSGLNIKHPGKPTPLRCCISSAILLRAGAFGFTDHII